MIKSNESGSTGADCYISNDSPSEPFLRIEYNPILTNLTITYDDYFAINQNNLVTANYTLYSDSSPIENATCFFNSTTGAANMTYNPNNTLYEIYVIPDQDDIGVVTFSVDCSKIPLEPQYEEQLYTAGVFAGEPYNITIGLFENLNATTPYIDEFAYILLHGTDYNCTFVTGYEECWRISEYNDGIATFNDTLAVGNFSIYFISSSVTSTCDLCPPIYENTPRNLKHLGDFIFDQNRNELYLYISPFEMNWQREIIDWAFTSGFSLILLLLALVIALGIGLLVFTKGGQNLGATILAIVVGLIFTMFFLERITGIDIGLTSIINLILP
jgi:hypothetical protein